MDLLPSIFSTFFILAAQDLVRCQRDIGDLCTFKDTGKQGRCKLLSNCQKAIQLLQLQHKFPETCGYKGTVPIVCCDDSGKTPSTTSATTSTTIESVRQKEPNPKNVGAKSKSKCKEYSKYVYEEVIPVTLSGDSETYMKNECKMVAQGLVVGGEEAGPKEFPHMALIGYGPPTKKSWLCGGTLISERFVLTAGHCLYNRELGEAKYVRLGDLNIVSDDDDARPQELNIMEQIPHPGYNPPRRYNDMALLKLDKAANLSSYVRPACLHVRKEIDSRNDTAVATGWGRTDFFGDGSNSLLKVTLKLYTQAQCNETYRNQIDRKLPKGIVDQTQLCAGSPTQKKDTCQGDSGGPLQTYNKDEYCMYDIIGVTSFGKSCGVINVPGVYTRVSNYIEWIESVVWP